MAIVNKEVIFLGNFADADTNEANAAAETSSLFAQTFGSMVDPLSDHVIDVAFDDVNNDGSVRLDHASTGTAETASYSLDGAGNDTVDGGTGNDTVDGGTGDDVIAGGAGDDVLSGSVGNDLVQGGDGNDTVNLSGGDTVIFSSGDGSDTLTAFDLTDFGDGTTTDQLDVSNLTTGGGAVPVNTSHVTVTDTNGDGTGDAILNFPDGESITLVGVLSSQVSTTAQLEAIGIPASEVFLDFRPVFSLVKVDLGFI